MKKYLFRLLALLISTAATAPTIAQTTINVQQNINVIGRAKPIWVNLSGFTGEADQVLRFDLYVQGFNFTNAENAQYLIAGNNSGSLTARVTDNVSKSVIVPNKAYSGASLRRQVHFFVDEFVQSPAIDRKGICKTKIAFAVEGRGNSELYVSDFDGYGATAVTDDHTLIASPSWVPVSGKLILYYSSYKLGNPAIYSHDVLSRERKRVAWFGGSNLSPAPSPDGRKVAMILSKDGFADLYVANADGSNVQRLTKSREEESGPCWSSDGQWICFASKINERRSLCKVPASGGTLQRISTVGILNPTEPDWSPDGKWIAFTAQMGTFEVCVVPSQGGTVIELVAGEDPSWAPNSRTLIIAHHDTGRLSLLDAFTKQYKDVARVSSGVNSQPSWAR